MHASAMLFLFIIPVWAGFGNYIVPLQIGAADMAFPRINALSFWLLPPAGIIMFSGFLVSGGSAAAGWTAYSPLARTAGTGMDLWIIAVLMLGISSTIGAANFLVTMFRMRAPGMTMFRMPIFCWTMLVTAVLQLLATPVLAAALSMLFIDRNFGGAFFDPNSGGNAVLWQNVFWFYSHPAVYIMILPGHGHRLAKSCRSSPASRSSATRRSSSRRWASAASASACGPTTCSPPAPCSSPGSAS